MSKYIDADLYVDMQIYDDEHEEWSIWNGTIEELLDQWTEEGCPPTIEVSEDMGEVSDGYHTFNQLYHQRAVLFATIVNQNKDKAWKSWKHEDGKFCFDKGGEWFIVGIDTPEGSYTYHYEQRYWDMFDCEELDMGKHWDGHTEEDVTRLLSLPPVIPTVSEDCISREYLKSFEYINKGDFNSVETIREWINNAPSVVPKRSCYRCGLREDCEDSTVLTAERR